MQNSNLHIESFLVICQKIIKNIQKYLFRILQCMVARANTLHHHQASVTTKIFEDFGEVLYKEYIIGWEPLSIVHYTRLGTTINHPLH